MLNSFIEKYVKPVYNHVERHKGKYIAGAVAISLGGVAGAVVYFTPEVVALAVGNAIIGGSIDVVIVERVASTCALAAAFIAGVDSTILIREKTEPVAKEEKTRQSGVSAEQKSNVSAADLEQKYQETKQKRQMEEANYASCRRTTGAQLKQRNMGKQPMEQSDSQSAKKTTASREDIMQAIASEELKTEKLIRLRGSYQCMADAEARQKRQKGATLQTAKYHGQLFSERETLAPDVESDQARDLSNHQ